MPAPLKQIISLPVLSHTANAQIQQIEKIAFFSGFKKELWTRLFKICVDSELLSDIEIQEILDMNACSVENLCKVHERFLTYLNEKLNIEQWEDRPWVNLYLEHETYIEGPSLYIGLDMNKLWQKDITPVLRFCSDDIASSVFGLMNLINEWLCPILLERKLLNEYFDTFSDAISDLEIIGLKADFNDIDRINSIIKSESNLKAKQYKADDYRLLYQEVDSTKRKAKLWNIFPCDSEKSFTDLIVHLEQYSFGETEYEQWIKSSLNKIKSFSEKNKLRRIEENILVITAPILPDIYIKSSNKCRVAKDTYQYFKDEQMESIDYSSLRLDISGCDAIESITSFVEGMHLAIDLLEDLPETSGELWSTGDFNDGIQ